MRKIRPIRIGLPHTLREASAIDDKGEKLFTIPKILVFQSKTIIDIIGHGIRNIVETIELESKVYGYIVSIYGDQAYMLNQCIQQIQYDNKEISIVGYLNNRIEGRLTRVSVAASSFINDQKGPHTGWIKIIGNDYKLSNVQDKIK